MNIRKRNVLTTIGHITIYCSPNFWVYIVGNLNFVVQVLVLSPMHDVWSNSQISSYSKVIVVINLHSDKEKTISFKKRCHNPTLSESKNPSFSWRSKKFNFLFRRCIIQSEFESLSFHS